MSTVGDEFVCFGGRGRQNISCCRKRRIWTVVGGKDEGSEWRGRRWLCGRRVGGDCDGGAWLMMVDVQREEKERKKLMKLLRLIFI